jgi:nitrate/nitrite transporter NarK
VYAVGIPSGLLADRIGKEKVLTIGYAVFTLSSALMIIFTGGREGNSSLYAYVLATVFGFIDHSTRFRITIL